MKIIDSPEKKKILKKLNEQFGITKIPFLLLRFGKEKIKLYSGSLTREELAFIDRNLKIETIGLNFAIQHEDGIRLTLGSLSLFKNQITKNIIELNNNQAEQWIRGKDLHIISNKSYLILKHSNELIGCAKSDGKIIKNSIPKHRRIKD